MNIIHTKNFDSAFKKLQKHRVEYNNLLKILDIIENTNTFNELLILPQVKMYGFERMKYDKRDFYSFNLCKNGGVIRLIVKPKENNNIEIYLVTISFNHYDDFDIRKVNYCG